MLRFSPGCLHRATDERQVAIALKWNKGLQTDSLREAPTGLFIFMKRSSVERCCHS